MRERVRRQLQRHRRWVAVVASLALHAALFFWLVSRAIAPPPPTRAVVPIHIDLREIPSRPKAAPPPSVRSTPPAHATRPVEKHTAPSPSTAVAQPGPSVPETTASKHSADAPTASAKLIPRLPPGMFGPDAPEAPSHGVTLRNDGAEPDPEAKAAYDAERAQRRVQGWATEELADARAQRGLVNSYFDDFKHAMEDELSASPPPVDKKAYGSAKHATGLAFDSFTEQMQRYGRTGNPIGEVDPDLQDVHDRFSSNAQAMIRDPGGTTPMGAIGAAIENGTGGMAAQQLRSKVDTDMKLSALVELFQRRDGSVKDARLARTSGNKAFDDGVVAAAPKAASKLKPPSGPGLGTNPDEIHSLWEFKGTLRFKKKMKDLKDTSAAGAAMETLATAATGQLTFDEHGPEVLDMAHPTVEFTARLLRLY